MTDDFDDDLQERPVTELLSAADREAIQNLWGMGFTIVSRDRSEQLFDAAKPPFGFSYQWNDKPEVDGWTAVPYSRHPGIFAPFGTIGAIEFQGLYLAERPKEEVEAAHAESHRKAQKNVDDWFARNAAAGITGTVTVLSESSEGPKSAEVREVGRGDGLRTKIPPELYPHMSELLRERDRMVAEALKVTVEVPEGELREMHMATLRSSCLQIAIDVICKKYTAPLIVTDTKTLEDASSIPADMLQHSRLIFEVRDKLWENAGQWWGRDTPEFKEYQRIEQENPDWPRGKIMNAVLLPIAIENTRLVKGKDHGATAASN